MSDGDGGDGGMMNMGGMVAQLGIVNKLSTGHMMLDVVIAMIIPVIMKFITQKWPEVQEFLRKYILMFRDKWEDSYSCSISWTKDGYYYYDDDNAEPPNYILQEALDIYIGSQKNLVYQFEQSQAKLLESKKTKNDDANIVEDDEDEEYESQSEWLDRMEVNQSPPEDVHVMLQPNLRFMHSKSERTHGQVTLTTKIYTLEARGYEPQKQVEIYLQKALDYYKCLKAKKKGKKERYYYRPIFDKKAVADGESKDLVFKSYQLSEEKTFNSWFHQEKNELLELVDNFLSKKGKFQISGFPNKLGILLWGPPGTGKTTLIKALAQYTNRNIVEVPLTQIRTNQMLMDIMFDRKYSIEGEQMKQALPLKKIIFVFEDIDAAADVVKARTQTTVTRTSFNVPSQTFTVESFLKRDKKDDPDENNKASTSRAGARKPAKLPSSPFQTNDKQPQMETTTTTTTGNLVGKSYKDPWADSDQLNLAGLLNALDGVLDAPERIVVMTTNHPEHLDPALIRPGRINKKLYLGRLFRQEATSMVKHYFPEASKDKIQKFTAQFIEDAVTPAELESLCGICPTVDELIVKIFDRFQTI